MKNVLVPILSLAFFMSANKAYSEETAAPNTVDEPIACAHVRVHGHIDHDVNGDESIPFAIGTTMPFTKTLGNEGDVIRLNKPFVTIEPPEAVIPSDAQIVNVSCTIWRADRGGNPYETPHPKGLPSNDKTSFGCKVGMRPSHGSLDLYPLATVCWVNKKK